MIYKLIILTTICYIIFFGVYAQNYTTDLSGSVYKKEITIGDKCPDIEFKSIVNYSTSSIKISSFRGKLLILDFWATWCQPCIKMFPRTDSLKKHFDGKVEFLPITYEGKAKVKNFFEKMSKATGLNLFSVTDDREAKNIFKHSIVPHYVWIDKNGIVVAITGLQEINDENIKSVLGQEEVSLKLKNDINQKYNYRPTTFYTALMKSNDGLMTMNQQSLLTNAVLTKNIEGLPSYAKQDSVGLVCLNKTVQGLYRAAAGSFRGEYFYVNRSLWEVSDNRNLHLSDSAFMSTEDEMEKNEWSKENKFCYELKTPSSYSLDQKCQNMLQDINRYFGAKYGITGGIEKRKVKCLLLIREDTNDNLLVQKEVKNPVQNNAYYFSITSQPISELINALRFANQRSLLPVIDDTKFTKMATLELSCDLSDIQSVNVALKKYGLKIIGGEKEINMIVVKDLKE